MTPPYRVDLWENLGKDSRLFVVAIQGDDPARIRKVRGPEWLTRGGRNYNASNLKTYKFRRGEITVHLALNIYRIIDLLKHSDVMVISGWSSPVYLQFMLLSKVLRKPYLIFHESTDDSAQFRGRKVRYLKSRIFKAADGIIVPGISSRRSVQNLGVSDHNVFEGFNSVNMGLFARNSTVNTSATRHTGDAPHKYLYVGQLIERKRVDLLIREFASVRRPGDRLSIVGKGRDQSRLVEFVVAHGLSESVDFLGEISYAQLPDVFHSHHTLVLPSRVEVWGLVVNEALSAGLHTVVSCQCGVAASVAHMDGVYLWDEQQASLGSVMRKSALAWTGPIDNPEILGMTNDKFSRVIRAGVIKVLSRCPHYRSAGRDRRGG